MPHILILTIGLWIGAAIGVLVGGLCKIAHSDDEGETKSEQWERIHFHVQPHSSRKQ